MSCAQFQDAQLVEFLLSPDVQVQLPADEQEVKSVLSAEQVVKLFKECVPGVQKMLFRQQPGQCVLKFLPMAYQDGWNAFKGTPQHDHFKWLFRRVVHYAHE